MRHIAIVLAATLATATPVLAQSATPTPGSTPLMMPYAEEWRMTSKINGRDYHIYVSRPMVPPPPGGYPVVYVTDGDMSFHTAADQARLLHFGGEALPAVVVGIGYDTNPLIALMRRNTDLTPDQPAAGSVNGMAPGSTYGDAEGFYRFITEELRPKVNAAFPTATGKDGLFGHSLGGLFALHVLFNHPESFRTFVASSPSIWWNNRSVLAGEAKFKAAVESGKVAPRILIDVGSKEQSVAAGAVLPPGMTREQVEAMMTSAAMVDNASQLAARLKAVKGKDGYLVESQVFEAEGHLSVVPAAISRGLGLALRP
jgi:predicted alpha/beta superfamily hydrolase